MPRALLLLLWIGGISTLRSAGGQSIPSLTPPGDAAKIESALRAQDLPEAVKQYRAMLAADPGNSEAWTGLGVVLYGMGHAAEAADALTHALQLRPNAPRAELFLSFSRADLQQCDRALPVLQHYFATEPVGKLQRLTGLTLLQCSSTSADTARALQTAGHLQQNYPGDPDVLYESAELYTRMWNESANELLTKHPESYRVHQLAAEVNEAQGNFAQAIRQYRAALGQNPKLSQMHYRIGQLLLRAGAADADDQAMAEFRAELQQNPQSASSALAMGEIDRHQGKLPAAAADYELAIKLEPDLAEARVGLGRTLLAEHQVDASEAQLRPLLAAHPENAQAHYAMMLAYREQGKLPEAATEMAAFQRLQRGSENQFQKKLNALLSGSTDQDAAQGSSETKP